MQIKTLTVKTQLGTFPVHFVDEFRFVDELFAIPHSVVIVGRTVHQVYKKLFQKLPADRLIVVPMEEKYKNLDTVMKLYARLLSQPAKRNLTLISFGGGANQDIVGFVASTLYRGVNWVYVPTTLLAMADSAIGLKTSLNFGGYKNLIGTFYPPKEIYINVDFVDTLSRYDYASGLGEIIKFLLMKDGALQDLDTHIRTIDKLRETKDKKLAGRLIAESIHIKLSYMKGDEFDHGRRNLLNYGHELGHALESVSSFRVPHGIGVLLGISFANFIAVRRKWLDKRTASYINERLLLPNIALSTKTIRSEYFRLPPLLARLKQDKKQTGAGLVLVLPTKDLTLTKVHDLTIAEVREGLAFLRQYI